MKVYRRKNRVHCRGKNTSFDTHEILVHIFMLISLSLSFLICKVSIIILLSSYSQYVIFIGGMMWKCRDIMNKYMKFTSKMLSVV